MMNCCRAQRALARNLRVAHRTFTTSTTRLAPPEEHDIVVLGGGPAGLALAAALASSQPISSTHKITLLEASSLDNIASWAPPPEQYSNRVSSITTENVAFLSDIGVWPHLDRTRTRGVEEMQVWDGLSDARITFSAPVIEPSPFSPVVASTLGEVAPMATLLENLNLQRGSLRYLQERNKVELLDGRKVLGINADETGWPVIDLEGKDGGEPRSLRARLLIGADGANSPVKSYSKIETFGWAYNIHGIVASLEIAPGNLGIGMSTAWQRFLPEGPIAFLPLSDTVASLVWSTTPALAFAIKALPLDLLPHLINAAYSLPYDRLSLFLELLTTTPTPSHQTLSDALTALTSQHAASTPYNPEIIPDDLPPLVVGIAPKTVASFPLRLSHVDSYLGLPKDGRDLRTVLVGDAAHTIHPLAGQGLNMGLGDIQALVKTLEQTVADGGDVGAYNTLRSYPRARYITNHAILSTCDHLSTLYSHTSGPIVWARSTGLEMLNEVDGLKKLLMGGAGAQVKRKGEGAGGPWGVVADGVESVRSGVEMAKMLGGMLAQQVGEKFAQGVGRRR